MADALDALAAAVGIESGYNDIWHNRITATPAQIKAVLSAMGFPAVDSEACRAGLEALAEKRLRRLLEPVTVVPAEAQPGTVVLCLPAAFAGHLTWTLTEEGGARRRGRLDRSELAVLDRVRADGEDRVLCSLTLPPDLPEGYHDLHVTAVGGRTDACRLIVAPRRCWEPADAVGEDRVWGLGCQLYSLRSEGNWGLGNFTDLARLAGMAGREGAAAIGLNPLHALFPAEPRQCSPYSPASRDFLNVLYIDVEAVPEFARSEAAAALMADPDFRARLEAARSSDLVDYPAVAALMLPVLEALFGEFRGGPAATGDRAEAFEAFRADMGLPLRQFATFMALQEHFVAGGGFSMMEWHRWPEPYNRPDTAEVAAFAAEHEARVGFHEYLQWLADEQLDAAARSAARSGMRIGLYRDLAVGTGPASAAAWADGDALLSGVSVGAPPDLLNRVGQDWGLAPLDPDALRERAFQPFIASVRANMRHAGALRIDHAMGLMHQYWVPSGMGADQGLYVTYPFQDLLRVLALESRRHRCLVIGEDLGTVPAGFRDVMAEAGILSYRVLPFERTGDGLFARASAYPEHALVTGSTHDLATLSGLWAGRDLDWRRTLSLYPDQEVRDTDARERIEDRRRLIDALIDADLWPEHPPVDPESLPFETDLMIAIQRFLARTPSRLQIVPVEDALLEVEQMNLPGTIDEHPNWRRKLPVGIEALFADPGVAALAAALRDERGSGKR